MLFSYRCALFQLVALLIFTSLAIAADSLSSSDFTNCLQNATIRVNYAYVGFEQATGTITFDVSGTSTEVQKVKASLVVLAYGTQVYQRTFDPCDESTKVAQLCPVPKGTFTASGNQTVPRQYLDQIPSIAYTIPDLEGNATLTLISANNGVQVGCIQSGISNGKTLNMPQVTNAAMGIAASALALSGLSGLASAGFAGSAASPIGFGTVLGWFQTIAVTGMLSVDYPPIYRSFSKNFAFSTGLVSWQPMQTSIDGFRSRTGGNLTADNAQFLQTASLTCSDDQATSLGLAKRVATSSLWLRSISLTASNATGSANSTTEGKASHIVHGIGAFAEELMIPQGNVFMTALLIFAIVIAAITVGILLLKVTLELWALYGSFPKRLTDFRKQYWTLLSKTIANLILLLYGVWVTWCIFQFSLSDSWAIKTVAAVTLSVFTLILSGFALRIVILARRYKRDNGDASALYEDKETWEKYSIFYDSYKRSKWWIFMPFLFVSFCRGAILAAGNGHGLVQTVAQLTVETGTFLFLLWSRPFATTAGNWINISIQVVRVLSFVCVLVFVEQLGIAQTTKTITGVVLIVVQGALTGLLMILIAVNGLVVMCRENPHLKRRKQQEEKMRHSKGMLTSLSPHDSLLALSTTEMPRPSTRVPSMPAPSVSTRHTRMPSEPAHSIHEMGRASLVDNAVPFARAPPAWDRSERMSLALGRPMDARRPTLPVV